MLYFFDVLIRLLEVIAWPLVVTAALLAFKGNLGHAFGRLRRVRYGAAEAEFSDALGRAERSAPENLLKIRRPEDVTPSLDDADRIEELFRLAAASPRGAVMDAWRELELAAVGAALAKGRRVTGPLDRVSGIAAVEQLELNGDVSKSTLHFYKELRSLRNWANTEEFDLSPGDARRYVVLAQQLTSYFRQIRGASTVRQATTLDAPPPIGSRGLRSFGDQ